MIRIYIVKNTHNRAQARRYNAVVSLLALCTWESMPADSGYNSGEIRQLFGSHSYWAGAEYSHLVVGVNHGDPLTSGHYRVDPSRLSADELHRLEWLLSSGALAAWKKIAKGSVATSLPHDSDPLTFDFLSDAGRYQGRTPDGKEIHPVSHSTVEKALEWAMQFYPNPTVWDSRHRMFVREGLRAA